MSYFEDWIEPHIHDSELPRTIVYKEEPQSKLSNLQPKTLVSMLEDMGVPDNNFKEMVLDIMKKVKYGDTISPKQKNVLFRAIFF